MGRIHPVPSNPLDQLSKDMRKPLFSGVTEIYRWGIPFKWSTVCNAFIRLNEPSENFHPGDLVPHKCDANGVIYAVIDE